MGLDLTVISKPLPGHEAEFHSLLVDLSVDAGLMPDHEPSNKMSLSSLLGRSKRKSLTDAQKDTMLQRFFAIGLPAYAALGAPRVGYSAAADNWFRAGLSERMPNATESQFAAHLAQARGHHVLPLVPRPCDGLPVYNNADFSPVDETAFRGAFVEDCVDVLTKDERLEVWQAMLPPHLADYGHRLRTKAAHFAAQHNVSDVIGVHDSTWTVEGSPEAQAHIADSLGRWAIFWGERGHGSHPDF